jgi:hypothetical protein
MVFPLPVVRERVGVGAHGMIITRALILTLSPAIADMA